MSPDNVSQIRSSPSQTVEPGANPPAEYLATIYTAMGQQLDPDESYFTLDSRFMTLEEVLRSLPAGRLLDAGCGRGLLLRRLSSYHDCYGSDFDPGAVAHCQESGLRVSRVDLNVDQRLESGLPQAFDIIVISEVLEHLLDPRNALALLKRHLAPEGTLVLTVPNAVPWLVRLPVLFGREVGWLHYPSEATENTGHIRFYTISSMRRLLAEQQFSVRSVQGVSFRMNGRFWERLCYWLPRVFGSRGAAAPARMDAKLGRMAPSFSPGLLFVCRHGGMV